MARNDRYFTPPLANQTLLAVRGFNDTGQRSGGIVDPQIVEVPANTVLFRLYHDSRRRFGEWWFTPYEMKQVVDYIGITGAVTTDRSKGKSYLHAMLAVRHDWSNNSPRHLDQFVSIRLNEPLKAYHGEADHAPNDNYTDMQKAHRFIDKHGVQRYMRQIYFPKMWECQAAFTYMSHYPTDTVINGAIERHRRGPLPFER